MARKPTSTYSSNEQFLATCDLTYALSKIGGRWKLQILHKLEEGPCRYTGLRQEFAHITERMLSLQLKALENDGLITRHVYAEIPPRVEYALTPLALELVPILALLSNWGAKTRGGQPAVAAPS